MGKARIHAPQVKQGTIPLMKWGGHMHKTSQTRGHNPNKSAYTPQQYKPSDKPLYFGSTPPVPQIPYTQGLGILARTMQVDTP